MKYKKVTCKARLVVVEWHSPLPLRTGNNCYKSTANIDPTDGHKGTAKMETTRGNRSTANMATTRGQRRHS